MKQEILQLAKQYESQIQRLRGELNRIDKVTMLELKTPYETIDMLPSIRRNLDEFPGMRAAIQAALEKELKELKGETDADEKKES